MTQADFYIPYDEYLDARTGCYAYRSVRYGAAANSLAGLSDSDTLYDIGCGWTEFDYHLRTAHHWKGRYIPVDGAIAPLDLNLWTPPRPAEHFVALEILEHLFDPERLAMSMAEKASSTVVVSVPNPDTVDVLGIDDTHETCVTKEMLERWGFTVTEELFYGGVFSGGRKDSLLGVLTV